MPAVEITRDDVIQIIFTSGATADPKGVVIRHRNVLANVVPVEREVAKYRKYAWPFLPLRFVNLLPLSHMFGQSMASNVPPMVRGTVIFTRSLNPHDVLRLIKRRRVSVLVCVPKILDVLREYAVRQWPETAEAPPPGTSIPARWWRYRRVHRAFGLKFWAFVVGAAPLPPISRSSGDGWALPSSRATASPKPPRSSPSTTPSRPARGRSARRSRAWTSASPRTARSWCAART